MTDTPIMTRIHDEIHSHDVVLYMKGNKKLPQCGFSALVAGVMENLGVEMHDVNILLDQELRQAIKDYSDWPTIPQLYVKGEFIGGSDIVREMYESGELQDLLAQHHIPMRSAA
ncbi:MAG: Grx4 family monothiol glutaredoxin [Sphaerospermopsis sp. SIO1G2]|nr:Grx4 family monothiol glutaredoxin [Sphaerospermopsis sp. SIO1G2]